ncbi:TPA: polycomb group ring finger 3-like [Bos taurus]|nr:TPA: polycomb group ring finger 3-like [Bos taurus]
MRKQREFYHKLGLEVPGDIKGETCSAKQHLDPHRNETKADDSSNKEAAEEKQEEDGDYHRSDEQWSSHSLTEQMSRRRQNKKMSALGCHSA